MYKVTPFLNANMFCLSCLKTTLWDPTVHSATRVDIYCMFALTSVPFLRGQDGNVPECVLLVLLLEHAQPLLDPVQQVGALEAAASPVAAHHDGAEAAHQRRGPVHVKLLRHRLAAGCPVAARRCNHRRSGQSNRDESKNNMIAPLCTVSICELH